MDGSQAGGDLFFVGVQQAGEGIVEQMGVMRCLEVSDVVEEDLEVPTSGR